MGRTPSGRAAVLPLPPGRSLKTAAEALAALRLLGANPDGVTAEALAAELGKSVSTARYLLNTLCQEGYALKEAPAGLHRLVDGPPWGGSWGGPEPAAPPGLRERRRPAHGPHRAAGARRDRTGTAPPVPADPPAEPGGAPPGG